MNHIESPQSEIITRATYDEAKKDADFLSKETGKHFVAVAPFTVGGRASVYAKGRYTRAEVAEFRDKLKSATVAA